MSHPMDNSQWVTCLHFFARKSHQSCLIPWLTVGEWCGSVFLPGNLINHVSSHDPQGVSDTAFVLCQVVSSMLIPTNRQWVAVTPLYFFARQSHESCFTVQLEWPTGCEWDCFISLPGSLMNHVSFHNQQGVSNISLPGSLVNHLLSHNQQIVSDTTLFLCQAVLSIMPHPTTNREWVTLLYLFVSSIMSHPTTNREWVILLYFLPSYLWATTQWWTDCKSYEFFYQGVSLSCSVTNRKWVTCYLCQSLLFISQTGCEWECIYFSLPTIIPWWPWPSECGSYNYFSITLYLIAWATGSE